MCVCVVGGRGEVGARQGGAPTVPTYAACCRCAYFKAAAATQLVGCNGAEFRNTVWTTENFRIPRRSCEPAVSLTFRCRFLDLPLPFP